MKSDTNRPGGWTRYIVGAGVGGVVGAVAAVNVMIYSGVEGGYEAGLNALFEHDVGAGLTAVALLMAGPLIGVAMVRWIRRSG
jgi:divalent metal cation (Fe/Co/Zn/Cd) transporter